MSYRVGTTIVTLSCDSCAATLFEDKRDRTNLVTSQSLWRRANKKGWTSTSTKHMCRKCSQ